MKCSDEGGEKRAMMGENVALQKRWLHFYDISTSFMEAPQFEFFSLGSSEFVVHWIISFCRTSSDRIGGGPQPSDEHWIFIGAMFTIIAGQSGSSICFFLSQLSFMASVDFAYDDVRQLHSTMYSTACTADWLWPRKDSPNRPFLKVLVSAGNTLQTAFVLPYGRPTSALQYI